jgi:hypothetical protein
MAITDASRAFVRSEKREEDVGGDVVGFGLLDDSDPTGWATIHSCDIGHEGMICG